MRDEEALSTLKAQLAEAKVQLKDAEAKATSFAKVSGPESGLGLGLGNPAPKPNPNQL